MDWKILLGILIGLATSVFGNLLTPLVKSFWVRFLLWQKRGYHNTLRQQIKVLETNRDNLIRRMTESNRDFFLYLSQWLVGIFTAFVLACGCVFIGFSAPDTTERARIVLLNGALVFSILVIVLGLIMLAECRTYTSLGSQKRLASIDAQKAKLVAKLPFP